jgi:uncharacterized protein involved in exopolysaccharide biosynthesis
MNNGHKTALQLEAEAVRETAPVLREQNSIFLLLLVHRWFLFRCAMVAAVTFAAVALLISPQYESIARLMPPERSELSLLAALNTHGADELGMGLGLSNLLGLRTTGALFVGVLTSDTVENELVQKFDLRKEYRVRRCESARKRLAGLSDIAEDRKDGIITIRVRDRSPDQARQMCQAYVDELNRLVVQLATSSARREREFLEQRLKLAKLDLDQASRDLSRFSSEHSTVDIPQQAKAMVEGAAMLQGQLIAAESELRSLEQMYGPKHVRVRAAQARVDELQQQVNKLEELDNSSPDTPFPSLRKLPLLAVTYTEYYRKAKIDEALYESLTKQYEVARVQEAEEIPTVRILDSPSYPERRVSPPRTVIVIFGALLGIAVGIAWIMARMRWQQADSTSGRKALTLHTWGVLKDDARTFAAFVGRGRSA